VCLCVAAAAAAVFSFRSVVQETAIPEAAPDAYAEITVKVDGCSVARTEVEGYTPVRMLTWVVTDLGTDQIVLERDAEDEFEYRYFSPGRYSIQLKPGTPGSTTRSAMQSRLNASKPGLNIYLVCIKNILPFYTP